MTSTIQTGPMVWTAPSRSFGRPSLLGPSGSFDPSDSLGPFWSSDSSWSLDPFRLSGPSKWLCLYMSLSSTRQAHPGHLACQVRCARPNLLTRWTRYGRQIHLGHRVSLVCWTPSILSGPSDLHTCPGR